MYVRMFRFSLQILSEKFLIPKKIKRDDIMYSDLHVKFPLFLSDFNPT
jgi:hypothetical protein